MEIPTEPLEDKFINQGGFPLYEFYIRQGIGYHEPTQSLLYCSYFFLMSAVVLWFIPFGVETNVGIDLNKVLASCGIWGMTCLLLAYYLAKSKGWCATVDPLQKMIFFKKNRIMNFLFSLTGSDENHENMSSDPVALAFEHVVGLQILKGQCYQLNIVYEEQGVYKRYYLGSDCDKSNLSKVAHGYIKVGGFKLIESSQHNNTIK